MLIRPLEPADIPAVRTLDTEAFQDLFTRLTGKPATMTTREAEYYEHWRRTDPEGAMVLEHDGEIVAELMCHARGAAGWIGPLAVKPDCQARGLGKRLMDAAFGYFDRKGCRWAGLDTYPQNPVSVSLYLKCGMRILQTMLQLQIDASEWPGRADAAAPGRVVAATATDVDRLVETDERVSAFHRRPDVEFLLGWDKGAAFRLMDSDVCRGQAFAYQKRNKGVIGGLYVVGADSYAADVEALVSACVGFFRGIGLERVVVLCPGDDRRLFSLLYGWGASTVHTTIRLFKGDDRDALMAPDRAFIHAPFASEKG